MTLLDSTLIAADQATSYVGYLSSVGDVIKSILLSPSNNQVEFVDNISFGVSGLVQLSEPATSLLLGLGLGRAVPDPTPP